MGFLEELFDVYDAEIKTDEPMKKHTAFGVGGKADYYAEARSLYALKSLACHAKKFRLPCKIIGNGTNVLVSDDGFHGIIISTKRLSDVFFKKDDVIAMSGASFSAVSEFAHKNGLTGFEPLADIPGTIGGGVVQNAGAYGRCVSELIVSVETIKNGKLLRYSEKDCKFSYRNSRFKGKSEAVVAAIFRLTLSDVSTVEKNLKFYRGKRKENQPTGRTCGSVFTNPIGAFAGKLIEDAGLKGFSIGKARVSEKHANFIVAESGATASDVYKIIQYIKQKVADTFGVLLSEEVEYVGEF